MTLNCQAAPLSKWILSALFPRWGLGQHPACICSAQPLSHHTHACVRAGILGSISKTQPSQENKGVKSDQTTQGDSPWDNPPSDESTSKTQRAAGLEQDRKPNCSFSPSTIDSSER